MQLNYATKKRGSGRHVWFLDDVVCLPATCLTTPFDPQPTAGTLKKFSFKYKLNRGVEFHVGEQIKTRGILGEKGKGRPTTGSPRCTHSNNEGRKTTKNVYSTSVGSAALPESEASNYTYTKVQRKATEGTREKTKGISSTPTGQMRE